MAFENHFFRYAINSPQTIVVGSAPKLLSLLLTVSGVCSQAKDVVLSRLNINFQHAEAAELRPPYAPAGRPVPHGLAGCTESK